MDLPVLVTVRRVDGQWGADADQGSYEQVMMVIDCELNGCEQRLGVKHGDDGETTNLPFGLTPEKLAQWLDKGEGSVGGHRTRLLRRRVEVGPWVMK